MCSAVKEKLAQRSQMFTKFNLENTIFVKKKINQINFKIWNPAI